MKNKKLIGQLEFIQEYECKTDAEKKAIDKAIKILEGQPCEDCISREAVMHILDEVGMDFDTPREAVVPIDCIADMVADLSSVTPQIEPSEDCISRAEVHDLLATWLSDYLTDETREALETIDGKIEDMLPVTPWSSWTPASQLPPSHEAVLLHVKYKSSGQWTYLLGMWNDSKQAWEDWITPYRLEEEFDVIAWMELPERYEEDKDG